MFHVLLTNMVEENIYLNFRLKKKNRWNKKLFHGRNKAQICTAKLKNHLFYLRIKNHYDWWCFDWFRY